MKKLEKQSAGEFYERLGRIVRLNRRSSRYTQEELGEALGLTRASVSNIERGNQRVMAHTFAKLIEMLTIPLVDIMRESEEEKKRRPSRGWSS